MSVWNTRERFGSIAIFFHWVMAILILGMIGFGWYIANVADKTQRMTFIGWHKEFGVLVLMLALLRLIWRMVNVTPELSDSIPYVQRIAARSVHVVFYVLMIAIPLVGWLMSSAAGYPVSFFGLFTLPSLLSANKEWAELFETIHGWLAYTLLVLIGLHVAAALKHHFIDKNDILRRMWL